MRVVKGNMRASNNVRWMSLVLGLALVIAPATVAADPIDDETAIGVDGHDPSDPEELGRRERDARALFQRVRRL